MRRHLIAAVCLAASTLHAAPPDASLANPGFEDAVQGWGVSKDDARLGLSKITAEAARCGQKGLRVEQEEGGPGSWFQSRRMAVQAGARYRIEFWARTINTSNVGVWIHFFDAQWKPIAHVGGPPLAVQVPADAPEWTAYHIDVVAPANAESITLAVRCNRNQSSMADFDDFSITPLGGSAATP